MQKLESVFSDVLGVPLETITDETSPENTASWDSLQSMNLTIAIEETYNVRLSTKEMLSMKSVGMARKVLRDKGIQNI